MVKPRIYGYVGGPLCGRVLPLLAPLDRLWVARRSGRPLPDGALNLLEDDEVGVLLVQIGEQSSALVHPARIVRDAVTGVYLADHRHDTLRWIDLSSRWVEQLNQQSVAAYRGLALFLMRVAAAERGVVRLIGHDRDEADTVVMRRFAWDNSLRRSLEHFRTLRRILLAPGDQSLPETPEQ